MLGSIAMNYVINFNISCIVSEMWKWAQCSPRYMY